jgi:predicted Zn-dependent peptidase
MIRRLVAFILLLAPVAVAQQWQPPTQTKKLANGLVVIVGEDHSAPTIGICVTYGIGFRLEPEGRTGFAHLFEHMMFEGTPVSPKGVFDQVAESGGGFINGDTRYDYTEYIESASTAALDPMLWLEADRMKTLDFSQKNLDNQRAVVEEEVRVNVMNRPYGLFYAIDLPGKAWDTYPNAHNFYGDFKDLDAANIQDVQSFYEQYYAPNNAVLAVVGDVKSDEVFQKIEKYFGAIPERKVPPKPNLLEKPQTAERRFTQDDKLATLPALGIGYRMPPKSPHESVVAAVTGELLHNGQASRLYQYLVKEKQVAVEVQGGVNWPLGTFLEYSGPTLMTSFIVYPANLKGNDVVTAYDTAIEALTRTGPKPDELERIRNKMRSDWYDQLETPLGRASALAHAALLDGDPLRVYAVPDEINKVTPEEVRAFAVKYLVKTNRTIIDRVPAAKSDSNGGKQ